MAKSPAHRIGQIIGYAMEEAFYPLLRPIADEFGLYLDIQGPRAARGTKKKVTWADDAGNKHDLDFVMEKNGTEQTRGEPVAFIESAWRRYTKHTVNKAGEIANALGPLRRTYSNETPFLGALVAGEWTPSGKMQMTAQGVRVLHLDIPTIADAFASEGVDVYFDQSTPEEHFLKQIKKWDELGTDGQVRIVQALQMAASEEFAEFAEKLRAHFTRRVERVVILPLHGVSQQVGTLDEAKSMLAGLPGLTLDADDLPFIRVEVQVVYSTGSELKGIFTDVVEAIDWLDRYCVGA